MNKKTKPHECDDCEKTRGKYKAQFADILRQLVKDDLICDSQKSLLLDGFSHEFAIASIVYRLPVINKTITDRLESCTMVMVSPELLDDVKLLLSQPRNNERH